MQVWTKDFAVGKVELRVKSRSITVVVNGEVKGTTGRVTPLDATARKYTYKHAPLINSAGEPITHAAMIVMLTKPEGEAVEAMLAEETRLADERDAANQLAKYATQHAEAKATGKSVAVDRWMDDCDDPREDCSTDAITRWVNPDGTFKITRKHTW